MKFVILVGTRPNFMKIAPIIKEMERYNAVHGQKYFDYYLVHSGQHYDYEMSKVFFEELEIPEPDCYLNVGSGTHAQQTAGVMRKFEEVLLAEKPDNVMLVGDVNSTLAGAITTSKLHIPISHIEAGVRSGDRSMPEEVNRLLTDMISDQLFTPSESASDNLRSEGVPDERIFTVGNVMVDSLFNLKTVAEKSPVLSEFKLTERGYVLFTLHRAANVDDSDNLHRIASAISKVSERIPVVFPAHPRTRKNLEQFQVTSILDNENIQIIKPQGYINFLKLLLKSKFVITDSGGIEPETTVLGIPCLTLMDTTAWQETVELGTNVLVGDSEELIVSEAFKIMEGSTRHSQVPPLWDGETAGRIVEVLAKITNESG